MDLSKIRQMKSPKALARLFFINFHQLIRLNLIQFSSKKSSQVKFNRFENYAKSTLNILSRTISDDCQIKIMKLVVKMSKSLKA